MAAPLVQCCSVASTFALQGLHFWDQKHITRSNRFPNGEKVKIRVTGDGPEPSSAGVVSDSFISVSSFFTSPDFFRYISEIQRQPNELESVCQKCLAFDGLVPPSVHVCACVCVKGRITQGDWQVTHVVPRAWKKNKRAYGNCMRVNECWRVSMCDMSIWCVIIWCDVAPDVYTRLGMFK